MSNAEEPVLENSKTQSNQQGLKAGIQEPNDKTIKSELKTNTLGNMNATHRIHYEHSSRHPHDYQRVFLDPSSICVSNNNSLDSIFNQKPTTLSAGLKKRKSSSKMKQPGELNMDHFMDQEDPDSNQYCSKSLFLSGNNSNNPFVEAADFDELSLLQDLRGDCESIEDPFNYGTEKIMNEIIQDEIWRSVSKASFLNYSSSRHPLNTPYEELTFLDKQIIPRQRPSVLDH
jgi:hypothetical protein